MSSPVVEGKQPWVTCLFTRILLDGLPGKKGQEIDHRALFRGAEGFEIPADPESFLRNVTNWVPINVLSELLWRCEEVSEQKDFGYHAALSYFRTSQMHSPSLFEILVWVLNDIRAVLNCSGLWGSVLTNCLTLQSLDGEAGSLILLAKFDPVVGLTPGGFFLQRGIYEGFPLLYPSVESVRCIEEMSQLKIQDVIREFPDFAVVDDGTRLFVEDRASHEIAVEALPVALRAESVASSADSDDTFPVDVVVASNDGEVRVLTGLDKTDPKTAQSSVRAYKIIRPAAVSCNKLSYFFEKDRIYNAPYSRFRFVWKESREKAPEVSVKDVRSELSRLLFQHLRQVKDFHTRMIRESVEKGRLTLENVRLREELEHEYGFSGIVARSQKMHDLYGLVRSVAETDLSVLIQGETGTGKELLAKAIHYNSLRKEQRFVSVNCGALSETLLESELFGYEKGAFTGAGGRRQGIFEAADGGTLFLDEIGEITAATQVRLLRVLQEGEFQRVGGTETIKVDVRVIAATNQNLEGLIEKGRFRHDLYYRLNVFPIRLPPLRERVEDIPLLVAHFIAKAKERLRKNVSGMSAPAMAALMAYSWPGNVRELENTVQRMIVVAREEILDLGDLPVEISGVAASTPKSLSRDLVEISKDSAAMIEKAAILAALAKESGNVTKAARSLGISRVTLQKKMKAYGLRAEKSPSANGR
jgi:DNA-binding NtrC family response regulator